jgi:2-polyprenyl-6-methoxyphenol hydroxylase-like FAD-dependent oxidoreductase
MDFVASHLDTYSHPWVKQVVNHTALSYIWKCKTLMNIDRYAHGKYVLMGDAAHVYIPFTSQGTNQAIEDVQTWVNLLDQGLNQEEMNERYNALRVNKAQGLVNEGIQFAARFCNGPTDFMIDQIPLVFAND